MTRRLALVVSLAGGPRFVGSVASRMARYEWAGRLCFDGETPYAARGCIAQAWSVAEVLRAYLKTAA